MKDSRKKYPKKNEHLIDIGRIPPQAVDLEMIVLGAAMLEKKTANRFYEIINPSIFYKEAHQLIAQTILKIMRLHQHPDIVLVSEELKKSGNLELAGGAYYLTQLTNRISSTENFDVWVRIIEQMWMKREMIRIAYESIQMNYENESDPFENIEFIEKGLKDIFPEPPTQKTKTTIDSAINDIIMKSQGKIKMYYNIEYPTWDQLAAFCSGFNILAGPSGVGKTTFLVFLMSRLLKIHHEDVSICWTAIDHETGSSIFRKMFSQQLKMTDAELQSKDNKVNQSVISNLMSWKEHFSKYDIEFIEKTDTLANLLKQFRSFVDKRVDTKKKFHIFILDNLMSVLQYQDDNKWTAEAGTLFANTYNQLRDKNVLMLVLHHMTKQESNEQNVEKGFRPGRDQLRGSALLDGKADRVILLNRPGAKDEIKQRLPYEWIENMLIVDVAKNTNGPEDKIYWWGDYRYAIFDEITEINNKKYGKNQKVT